MTSPHVRWKLTPILIQRKLVVDLVSKIHLMNIKWNFTELELVKSPTAFENDVIKPAANRRKV